MTRVLPPPGPLSTGANQWRWPLEDLAAVRVERRVPPFNSVAGAMHERNEAVLKRLP